MHGYSIRELAQLIEGRLRLGDMPPLGGEWEPIGRVVVDVGAMAAGDVLLLLPQFAKTNRSCAIEAFARGALGVIFDGKPIEPWAGKFSLQVADARRAWAILLQAAHENAGGVAAINSGASAIAASAYGEILSSSSCLVSAPEVNAASQLRTTIATCDALSAATVEPSQADALIFTVRQNSRRSAA